MTVSKEDNNISDDGSQTSGPSLHCWYPIVVAVDNVPLQQSIQRPDETVQSILLDSSRLHDQEEIEDDDSHLYPPFASAALVGECYHQQLDLFPANECPVPHTVEVDVDSGTIRVEVEQNGSTAEPRQNTPVSNLNQCQKSWLIVFLRKWARKSGAFSRMAARKCTPKVKRVTSRSAAAIKDASVRSVSFVQKASVQCKDRAMDFNQKHHVAETARSSVKAVGRHVKQASKATAKGVQKVSLATVKGAKEVEEKHHIMRKSKRSLKKGGNLIRNVWNGKSFRTSAPTRFSSPTMQATSKQDAAPQTPEPTSE